MKPKEQEPTLFIGLLKNAGLPLPEAEYRFCERKWRFDFAWPEKKVAVECEGGLYSGGRHVRGTGFLADMEKYNKAVLLGWKVLRYSPEQMLVEAIRDLMELLNDGKI
ncbi:MAG: hypothetical protein A2W47_04320 [Gammaproteobacteria bacterium RIFCSPHIGHO2_12_38_15]|nr:MAG: hypothetical protein A2W47_04320 [Gammaproteobacteria bacterium RIFCSPHIGHO2_12_38_15]